jgi:hypothetical protein
MPDSSTTEGILLPPFPPGSQLEDLRLIKPGADWIWVNLWDQATLWVEYYNGAFILHAINIPALNTQPMVMSPDEVWRLAIQNGTIYLKDNARLREDAFISKVKALKTLANFYVDRVRSILGSFVAGDEPQIDYLVDISENYNTHLTNLISLPTYQQIQAYNIETGWPG